MSERVVTLLDGTRYVFPEGTPERVINRAMIRQRNRQQREQRYQERQQARETADQYRAGRERIMGSELPADDTGAIRDVRQYLSERQLAEDIGAESAAMRAEEIAGPRDVGRERFMSASQGLSLGSAPFLQGGVTGIAGALAYPFMGEEAREGRSYPEFISEMTSRGYQRARTDIDRAREDRPIETLTLEAAGGFGTGKTIYDRAASRYFPDRPGVAGATVGAGTGAQYGFLDTEGDPEMTALGAGLGGPFGAGVAKALQAAAGPVGRMFRGEPAQVPEPEPELPAGEYLRRRSMRAGSPVMGERTQQLRADWEPVTADLTGASTTAQSAARATEAATQARTPDALSAALAAKRALRTKIEGIVEARAGASTPEDQRLADALEALSQDTRDPVQLGTQVSVARNNLDRVLEGLGQGREGNLSPVPTRPPVRRTFSPEEEARTIPDEAGRPSRTRYAETPDDTQMGLSGNATLTNAFAGGAIGAVAPAETAEERARNVALGVGLGAGASRLGLRAGGARGMGVGADDVPRPVQQARKSGYEGSDTGESQEWLAARAKGLPMDTTSRMARAQEMGFDTDTVLYHGTIADDFNEFNTNDLGLIWLSTDKDHARTFGPVKEFFIRKPNGKYVGHGVLDVKDEAALIKIARDGGHPDPEEWAETIYNPQIGYAADEALAWLLQADFNGQTRSVWLLKNWETEPGGYSIITDDPSNIRSVNAAFDPDNAGSSTLLAAAPFAVGGAALGAGATDD
jgi:hypothetical protein